MLKRFFEMRFAQVQLLSLKIDYPGIQNYSALQYDGLWRNTKIVETVSGSVVSVKQFIGSTIDKFEERDAGGNVVREFYKWGQTVSANAYFYAKAHLESITELSNVGGSIVAQYAFDSFGRRTKLSETVASDFQYAGYYFHSRSELNLTAYREYSSDCGKWITRDPVEEDFGANLFAYVDQNPISNSDPFGLFGEGTAAGTLMGGPAGGLTGLLVDTALLVAGAIAAGGIIYGTGYIIVNSKAPDNAYNPDGPKAPGKPTAEDGFNDPKGGEQWVPNPNQGKGGGSHGWLDDKGRVWVPTGQGGRAHGGPHWDVQLPGRGGKCIQVRPKKRNNRA